MDAHDDCSPGRRVRECSPLECQILDALREVKRADGWTTTEKLARKIGEKNSTELRVVIRLLAEAGLVETSTRHGIRIVMDRPSVTDDEG